MIIAVYRLTPGGQWGRINIIPKFKYAIWNRRFYEIGSFEISLPNDVGIKENDVIRMDGLSGIVMKTDRSLSGTVLYGYDLKGLTKRRMLSSQTAAKDTSVETQFKTWASCLTTGVKKIPGVEIETSKGITKTFSEDTAIGNERFSYTLENLAAEYNIGWDIEWKGISRTENKMIFTCSEPKERTDITISLNRRNIKEPHHITDIYDLCNATAEKQNEENTGLNRYEGDEITPSADYVTGEATETCAALNLGDIVTVETLGVTAQQQVTELQYIYEPNRRVIIPTYGENKKNIIKKLTGG